MPQAKAHAIFAVDPGVTTGCCTAVVDLGQNMVGACIRRAVRKDLLRTWNVTGCYVEQVWAISRAIDDFFFQVHVEKQLIRAMKSHVVMESFRIDQLNANITPVRILAGVEVLLSGAYGDDFEMNGFFRTQSASEAKSFCSDKMLKSWGLWDNRTPHERDAVRHLSKRLDRLLSDA